MNKKIQKIISIIIVAMMIGIVVYLFFINNDHINKQTTKKVTIVNEIKNYNYKLDDNKPQSYKKLFEELKVVLAKEQPNDNDYASVISKMFIVDFYTLSNKITKYDVGGTIFIHPSIVDNFIKNATDTVYKYIDSNIYGDRNQELPEVKSIEVLGVKTITAKYLTNKIDNNAIEVNLKWTYKMDLGYETTAKVILIHEDKKLFIVEMD